MYAAVHSFELHWKRVFAALCYTRHVMSQEGTLVLMKYGSLLQKFYQSDKGNIKCFNVMYFKPGVPRPNHRQSDLDLFIGFTDQSKSKFM